MKLECFGWYGRGNVGDEAFKLAHKVILPPCEIEHSHRANRTGLLILGGGDVAKPYYLDQIPPYRPYYALGIGLGYESEIELFKGNLQAALFRNKKDVEIARAAGIKADYTPDLTFAINPPAKTRSILSGIKTTQKKTVGVFLSDCFNPSVGKETHWESHYGEYFKWEMAKALEYLQEWYEVVFIPMSQEPYSYDLRVHMDILCRMKTGPKLVLKPLSPIDTIKVISELDLVVGMKYHSLIFSTLVGTPFINIGLTRKTELFCEEEGLSHLSIPKYSFTKDRLIEIVKKAEISGVREYLLDIAANKKRQLVAVQNLIQKEWLSS